MFVRWLPALLASALPATLASIAVAQAPSAPPRLHVRAVAADTAYVALEEPAYVAILVFEPGTQLRVLAPILPEAWEPSTDGVIRLRRPVLATGVRLVDPPHCILALHPYSWSLPGGAGRPTAALCGPAPRLETEADDPPPTEGMWGRYLLVVAVDSAATPPNLGVLLRDANPAGRPVQWVAAQLRNGLVDNARGARWTFLAAVRLDQRRMHLTDGWSR